MLDLLCRRPMPPPAREIRDARHVGEGDDLAAGGAPRREYFALAELRLVIRRPRNGAMSLVGTQLSIPDVTVWVSIGVHSGSSANVENFSSAASVPLIGSMPRSSRMQAISRAKSSICGCEQRSTLRQCCIGRDTNGADFIDDRQQRANAFRATPLLLELRGFELGDLWTAVHSAVRGRCLVADEGKPYLQSVLRTQALPDRRGNDTRHR
jgi:hypothetical protein